MQATHPVGASDDSAGTLYGQGAPLPGQIRMNPFSSSVDPENQDGDQIPVADNSAQANPPSTTPTTLPTSQTGAGQTKPAPTKPTPKPGSKDFDPSVLAPGSRKEDFVSRGMLTPTVYYKPIFNEDVNKCKEDEKVNLRGTDNKVIASVCPKTKAACDLQGSCMVQQGGTLTSYNFVDEATKGYPHFSKVSLDVCPFGLGVKEACLDPFFNVAADMNFSKAGDVIFVPALVGLTLPGGAKHNGFLIVRDSGGGIEGIGRFDFFSGFYDWKDTENPFSKMKLTDKATKLPYYSVKGTTALKIKADRNYPSLPGFQKGTAPSF